MTQRSIPAAFMRGGTSKGLFFLRRDLPVDPADWDPIFLAAIGSAASVTIRIRRLGKK